MSAVEQRLIDLGIVLPAAVRPIANYVPAVRVGSSVVVSGQICFGPDGTIPATFKGKLGASVSEADGRAAARACAVNILAQVKSVVGDLDRVIRCVRLGGFINSTPGFEALPQVMNGASDLMTEIFGESGKHARTTVGVAQLPLDAAVEVEGIFECR